jgi:hypothetical protein
LLEIVNHGIMNGVIGKHTMLESRIEQARWVGDFGGGRAREVFGNDRIITTTQQTRSGIATSVVPETITQSLGDRVVDIVYYTLHEKHWCIVYWHQISNHLQQCSHSLILH